MLNHDALPTIHDAPLPATYEAAKRALAECSQLDECQMWANKAEALASYARQSEDDTLRRMCDRIQARAIRRCGELLQQIEPQQGANQNIRDGTDPNVTRTNAATAAGLSERQRKTALRVAKLPADEFEAAVEAEHPATVTALAERGTQHRYLKGRVPSDFQAATNLIGLADYITDRASKIDVDAALRGLDDRETTALLEALCDGIDWLTDIRERIGYALQPQ